MTLFPAGSSGSSFVQPTVLMAIGLLAAIAMMVLPMPAWLLDAGLALSFALAILMLTVTLFIQRPLDFSAFPTILLVSLLLRLSLNISSTKLIISQGHTGTDAAGAVIEGFATFVMGNDLVLGTVIFVVILIVNFMVITKGAGRMAEVGARFALDGLPGRQMAIDADLAAGAITQAEARARREHELAETSFFGSLDGASKFVKGDAVAGLLITLLNIIVGVGVGVLSHGMPVGDAFATYGMLTVGDGLVNQIPAVIISVAAALLLARGGNDKEKADVSFARQLGAHPGALGTVALLLALFAVVPGMPFLPFILCAAVAGWLAWRSAERLAVPPPSSGLPLPATVSTAPRPIGDVLDFDDLQIEFAPDLVAMVLDPAAGLDARIANMRNHVATSFGIILPEIRITDEATLAPGSYRIRVLGIERAAATIHPDHVMVITAPDVTLPPGIDAAEPVYGAKARWISPADQERAVLAGLTVVAPVEVVATHLLEVIKTQLAQLLTLRGLRKLLDAFTRLSDAGRAEANRRMLDDLVPDKVPLELLHAVLRQLLDERVSIRNLPLILEAVAEGRGLGGPEQVTEHVRRRLAFQIVADLRRPDGALPILQLAPEWEAHFARAEVEGPQGTRDVLLPPELYARLAGNVAQRLRSASDDGQSPAIVVSAARRRLVRAVLAARQVGVRVLSFDEITADARPTVVGTVPA